MENYFEDKNFSERALELINNFIEEFDSLFGEYVSKEELINRIKTNLSNIIFDFDFKEKNYNGTYSSQTMEIKLAKELEDNIEEMKSTFFHEMIHCITANVEEKVTCFTKNIWIEEEMDEEVVTCHGLTEGFTAYVTNIRDEKYAPKLNHNSYPILAEQTENLVDLLGKEKFLDIAFNKPDNLEEELEEKIGTFNNNIYGEIVWTDEIFDSFDIIWQEENEIFQNRNNRLLNAIFRK